MEQFLLFGDSITQQSGSQERGFAFAPALQDAYIRRLDIVNRGFSGYNTDQALKIVSRFIPEPENGKIRLMSIFFGANDARLPNTPGVPQNVPLERFEENLRKLATHPSVTAHGAQVILITPPPVDERLCLATDKMKSIDVVRRTAEHTARYAEAVRKVARQLEVPVLDVWYAFMKAAGWKEGDPLPGSSSIPQNPVLVRLLHDGLHLNPEGYQIIYDEMMQLIEKELPEHMPVKIPYLFPSWDDGDAW